jgi:hypothetical protein
MLIGALVAEAAGSVTQKGKSLCVIIWFPYLTPVRVPSASKMHRRDLPIAGIFRDGQRNVHGEATGIVRIYDFQNDENSA